MSIKLHYQDSHLHYFRQNLGNVSEEHEERFHQDILVIEKRYQGIWDKATMGDYIWCLIRDDHKLDKEKITFQNSFLTVKKNYCIVGLHICILMTPSTKIYDVLF